MGSETKVGLLVGMCFIVCFAIILAHRGAPVDTSEPQTFEVSDANNAEPQPNVIDRDREPDTPRMAERSERRASAPHRPVAVERPEPAPRRERPTPDAGRFGRRGDPIPAPAPARPAPRDFADSFAAAISNVSDREGNVGEMMEDVETIDYTTTTQGLLQAARPLMKVGQRAVDALSYAGTRLADQAQNQQRSREMTSQSATRRPDPNPVAQRESRRAADSTRTMAVNRPTQLPPTRTQAPVSRRTRETTSSVPAHNREATSTAPAPTYEVKPGDSLTRIAREVYGDDSRAAVDHIFAANQPRMKDRDHVIVGMKLKVQPMAGTDPAPSATRATSVDRLTQAVTGNTTTRAPSNSTTVDPELAAAKRDLQGGIQRLRQAHANVEMTGVARGRQASEASKQHTVQPGDTLVKIVRKNYGTDAESIVRAVYEANRDHLRSPDRILVGMKLDLPDLDDGDRTTGSVDTAARETAKPASVASRESRRNSTDDAKGEWFWYTLKPGDLYSTLAQEHLGSSRRWKELAKLNADIFEDPSHICHGVKIRIPGKAPEKTLALGAVGAER